MSSQRSNRGHLYHWWLISVTEEDVRVRLDHFKINPGFGRFDWMWKYANKGSELGIINAMVHNNWSFRSDLAEAVEQRKVLVTLLSFIQYCQWRNIPIKFLRVKVVLELRWIKRQLYVIKCTYIMLNFENPKRKNRSQSLQEWFWHNLSLTSRGRSKLKFELVVCVTSWNCA